MSEIATELVPRQFTTTRVYDPKAKAEAYELYLNTEMDLTDIAIKTGIPKPVLAVWVREGKWAVRKEDLEREYMRAAESKYRNFLLEQRLPTISRHLEICKMLEERIGEMLRTGGEIDSKELKRLSEALSASASVAARAAGVAEKVTEKSGMDTLTSGRRPLIAIGIAPTLAQGADITVKEGDVDEQGTIDIKEEALYRDGLPSPDGAGSESEGIRDAAGSAIRGMEGTERSGGEAVRPDGDVGVR